MDNETRLRAFFDTDARRFNDTRKGKPVIDAKGVADAFARFFVEASPTGVQGDRNGWLFRLKLPFGFRFHKGSSEQVLALPLLYSAPDLHNPAGACFAGTSRPLDSRGLQNQKRDIGLFRGFLYFPSHNAETGEKTSWVAHQLR